jgi:hypothetical protein
MNFDLRMERSLERGEGECKSVLEKLVVNEHLHQHSSWKSRAGVLIHGGLAGERESERRRYEGGQGD